MKVAKAALVLLMLSCANDPYSRHSLFAIDAAGGRGFGEDMRNRLHTNKDCGPVVVAATESLLAARHMTELSREMSPNRALVHFRTANDDRRYFEVLYRHDADQFTARLSFDLLTASGAELDPSTALSPEDAAAFKTALEKATDCL